MSSECFQVSGDSGAGAGIKAGDGKCYRSGAHFRVRAEFFAFSTVFWLISRQKPLCQCMLRRWGFSGTPDDFGEEMILLFAQHEPPDVV